MQAQEFEVVMIKGKRSKRPRTPSPLGLTMATSSSTTAAEYSAGVCFRGGVVSEVSAGSTSDSVELARLYRDEEEEDMANCLILLAKGRRDQKHAPPVAAAVTRAAPAAEVYQCKTCNKSFPSFQALGGHRASHKKPIKPIMAVDEKKASPSRDHKQESSPSHGDDHEDNTILSLQIRSGTPSSPSKNKTRVHECSICGAEFTSGQALGGHMRRHRPLPAASNHGEPQEAKRPRNLLSLDLNLPAPEDHDHHRESKFSFGPTEQVIVFSASPLVDCHY